jgi:hypothetical protein
MVSRLQPSEGLTLSALAPFLYIAPFYCAPGVARASREEPNTVLFRCCGAAAASAACMLLIHFHPRMPPCAMHHRLGLSVSVGSVALPFVMLLCVYLPSILDIASGKKAVPYAKTARHLVIRDLIVAPVSEELVFRGYVSWVRHASSPITPPALCVTHQPFYSQGAVSFQKLQISRATLIFWDESCTTLHVQDLSGSEQPFIAAPSVSHTHTVVSYRTCYCHSMIPFQHLSGVHL